MSFTRPPAREETPLRGRGALLLRFKSDQAALATLKVFGRESAEHRGALVARPLAGLLRGCQPTRLPPPHYKYDRNPFLFNRIFGKLVQPRLSRFRCPPAFLWMESGPMLLVWLFRQAKGAGLQRAVVRFLVAAL